MCIFVFCKCNTEFECLLLTSVYTDTIYNPKRLADAQFQVTARGARVRDHTRID